MPTSPLNLARLAHEALRSVEPDRPTWDEASQSYRSGIIFGTVYLLRISGSTIQSMYPDTLLTPDQQRIAKIFEDAVR